MSANRLCYDSLRGKLMIFLRIWSHFCIIHAAKHWLVMCFYVCQQYFTSITALYIEIRKMKEVRGGERERLNTHSHSLNKPTHITRTTLCLPTFINHLNMYFKLGIPFIHEKQQSNKEEKTIIQVECIRTVMAVKMQQLKRIFIIKTAKC